MKNKQSNRAKYPEIAAFMDGLRKYFPNAKVISLKERIQQE